MLSYKNILLAGLAKQQSPILAELQPIALKQRDILYDVGSTIDHIYFMDSGVGSLLTFMQDGNSIEVGMVGFEGLIGMSALLGENASPQHVVIQLPGKAFKIKTSAAKKEFEDNVEFRRATLRFVESFMDMSGQSVACNRLHQVERRYARWLLMSSDRVQSNLLPLTQEYLSAMVGVRRSGISEAATNLQREGYIRYKKGKIEILDRPGLERVACECYRLDNERFKRLIRKNS